MAAWAYHLPPARSAWSTPQWVALHHPLHHMTAVTAHCHFFSVRHHIGPSIVNLRMTRYRGVHVMVAQRMCCAASISISCVRSAWLVLGPTQSLQLWLFYRCQGVLGGLYVPDLVAMTGAYGQIAVGKPASIIRCVCFFLCFWWWSRAVVCSVRGGSATEWSRRLHPSLSYTWLGFMGSHHWWLLAFPPPLARVTSLWKRSSDLPAKMAYSD
jgi:hypothetical protein